MICKLMQGYHFFFKCMAIVLMVLVAVPFLFRLCPKIVMSGSMEPEIPVGSMVYIFQGLAAEQVQEQDVIVYELSDGAEIMHRVTKVNEQENYFHTKGDANNCEDLGQVTFSQYKGKAVLQIPYLGYGVHFFTNRYVVFGILVIEVIS